MVRNAKHGRVGHSTVFLLAVFFLNILSRTLLSPMLVSIEHSFSISHILGLISGLYLPSAMSFITDVRAVCDGQAERARGTMRRLILDVEKDLFEEESGGSVPVLGNTNY